MPLDTEQADHNPIVRHAPDDGGYHLPDEDIARRLRSNRFRHFAVVPRGRRDGSSTGFDAHQAGVVHVDPDYPNSCIVDLRTVDPRALEQAIDGATAPHEVYQFLGEAPQLPAAVPPSPRHNPVMPSRYLVPSSETDGRQTVHWEPAMSNPLDLPALSPITHPPQLQTQVSPGPALLHPSLQAAAPTQNDQLVVAIQQLSNLMVGLDQRMRAVETRPATVAPARTQPLSAVATPLRAARQKITEPPAEEEMADEGEEEVEPRPAALPRPKPRAKSSEPKLGVAAGFETLELPFVNGPVATKPTYHVLFDLKDAGTQGTWYHMVVNCPTCVLLAYDRRYEQGTQYAPADLKDKVITLGVPKLKREFEVSSLGLQMQFGVFDLIVLIKQKETEMEYED